MAQMVAMLLWSCHTKWLPHQVPGREVDADSRFRRAAPGTFFLEEKSSFFFLKKIKNQSKATSSKAIYALRVEKI